jgi:hypothetical protein
LLLGELLNKTRPSARETEEVKIMAEKKSTPNKTQQPGKWKSAGKKESITSTKPR